MAASLSPARAARWVSYVVAWAVVAVPAALLLFTHTSRSTVLASHDAVVTPTIDGWATIRLGPFLPDVRDRTGGPVGVDIALGKTEAGSLQELVQRYAFIAADPDAQIAKARGVVTTVAWRSAGLGALGGLVPLGVWWLVGPVRRRELVRSRHTVAVGGVGLVLVAGAVLVWAPWQRDDPTLAGRQSWQPLPALVPELTLPAEARSLQVRVDVTTANTKALVASAVDTYDRSKTFYSAAREAADDLVVRQPATGEQVAVLVSDRHDNIGMDAVVRAVADRADATWVVDAGDDTSTGSQWEAFSLDSLIRAFRDYDRGHRLAIAGNHDNGPFVSSYLERRGWTHLTGSVVDGPTGARVTGVDDPRSSGLGTWRKATGLSFADQTAEIADSVCAADADGERIATLVVHDGNSGKQALARGCVDLVLSGHTHVQTGPTRVDGTNGKVGWAYTNGTTGGAAYAIAVGSKLRREAGLTLVTYADGRPVGVQPVALRTDGVFEVDPYVPLTYDGGSARTSG